MNSEPRLQALVDERLFSAFWDAVAHFKTTDLVLYFDTTRSVDPVSAHVREKLVSSPEAPEFLRKKLCKPAMDAAVQLRGSATAFWLVASFPDGEMICTAIIAEPMGRSGMG